MMERPYSAAWLMVLSLCLLGTACDGGGAPADADVDAQTDGDADSTTYEVPEGCNPLAGGWDCLLPYPSDVFLTDDGLTIPEQGGIETNAGDFVDITATHHFDGFPVMPLILALFPEAIDDSDLPFFTDEPEVSTSPDSQTILLEADTGTAVAHFAELDPRAEEDLHRALIIHPMAPLKLGTRYIVAIQGLNRTDGSSATTPPGFAAIRDDSAGDHEVLGPLAERYESEIFPVLEDAGIARQDLQLAWDFTTASQENLTGDMLRVRELAMAEFETTPPTVTIDPTGITEEVNDDIARRISGTLEVPLYMESEGPGARLNRGADGRVVQNGTAQADFLIVIPRSVADSADARPARVIQFGHGFFGTREEIDGDFVQEMANRTGMVVAAVDWWGMSTPDRDIVVNDIVGDLSQMMRFTDRVHQGMVNQIALTYALQTTLAAEESLMIDGDLVYDPQEISFYGISMGHILGGTYLALAPNVRRAALSVGGCGFSLIMFRSLSFASFFMIIGLVVDDPLDHQRLASLSQSVFDRVDSSTYARFLVGDPLPGSPDELPILIHAGLGDAQVPNIATHTHARALGATLFEPSLRSIPGIPSGEPSTSGTTLVEFDLGVPEPLPGTIANFPAEPNEVHDGVRRLQASMDQIDAFFHPDGQVRSFCDGVCDPE